LPTVSIVDPSSGAVLNPDANNRASVHVLAMAADDVAVMEVELWVDNQAVGADAGPPYEWDIELDLGDHDLRAVATDLAGNEGESTIVTIAVGSSGPVTTGTSTSGGGPGPSGTGDSGASGADSGADGSSGADTEGDNSGGFGFDGSQGGSSCACTTSRRPATGFGLAALALWFGTRRRKKPRSSAQPSRARRIENRRRPATKPAQRRGEADES
jgi:MYXO-CTERM domain-containing protein